MEQRLDQHHHGKVGYTAKRKPIEFLWSAEFAHLDDAYAFERQVKGARRRKRSCAATGLKCSDWRG
ncbi:hypothetical protein U91I_03421 [alpha proteobacterium U9-1i]|nr:hypothetical protein U91I_03421 [alpha proteobacterium U9-1i]